MSIRLLGVAVAGALLFQNSTAAELLIADDAPLQMPAVGAHQLRVISPSLLELTLITTKLPDPARVSQWDFIDAAGAARLPGPRAFVVSAGGKTNAVKAVGFKRRV